MEKDKLVTLAIHTYQKAQMLKMLLEDQGIEVSLHNVNLIQPVVSAGVRIRIKETDLPAALKFIEENQTLVNDIENQAITSNNILIPIDFTDYSIQACEIGFHFAHDIGAEVTLLHACYSPYEFFKTIDLTQGLFNPIQQKEEENKALRKKAKKELTKLKQYIKDKIATGEWEDVSFRTELAYGLPEDEIAAYTKYNPVSLIIMGTRGKERKDMELIGSVTADVINQTHFPVLAIPENTPFRNLKDIKKIAFATSFDQKDLIVMDSLIKMFQSFSIEYYLFHLSHKKDAWDEVKLAGIKEYFANLYPEVTIHHEIIDAGNFLSSLEDFTQVHGIDIISLASNRRTIVSRLFNPSVAHKMLFHTDTPLLAFRS
jgi:Universal stress protein UspA and related nucleotide-binding proteins